MTGRMGRTVIVIGGGAAGLMAAISASRSGAEVTLLEKNERLGKKLSQTGNGRGNYTNILLLGKEYRGNDPAFPSDIVRFFPPEKAISFFRELGVIPKFRRTYVYPASEQASCLTEALEEELRRLGVRIISKANVLSASPRSDNNGSRQGFLIHTNKGDFCGDAVILSTGGMAHPETGSDGGGYRLAACFKHTIVQPVPALTSLQCGGRYYKEMAGARAEASICLEVDGSMAASDRGELQFTDYGISGIPAFQVSRFASRGLQIGKDVKVHISFLPDWENGRGRLRDELKKRKSLLKDRPAKNFLIGFVNSHIAFALMQLAGIRMDKASGKLNDAELSKLAGLLTDLTDNVISVNPFSKSQCTAGGVSTREIIPGRMESKLKKNLFFAGEIVDVDGICGGYNLHFAWASGMIAGKAAACPSFSAKVTAQVP